MTSGGSPYSRFQRALATGDLTLVRATAAELPRVSLSDALRMCLVMRDSDGRMYERAGVRWLGRFCLEANDAGLEDVRDAADAFAELAAQRDSSGLQEASALEVLTDLCARYRLATLTNGQRRRFEDAGLGGSW